MMQSCFVGKQTKNVQTRTKGEYHLKSSVIPFKCTVLFVVVGILVSPSTSTATIYTIYPSVQTFSSNNQYWKQHYMTERHRGHVWWTDSCAVSVPCWWWNASKVFQQQQCTLTKHHYWLFNPLRSNFGQGRFKLELRFSSSERRC